MHFIVTLPGEKVCTLEFVVMYTCMHVEKPFLCSNMLFCLIRFWLQFQKHMFDMRPNGSEPGLILVFVLNKASCQITFCLNLPCFCFHFVF